MLEQRTADRRTSQDRPRTAAVVRGSAPSRHFAVIAWTQWASSISGVIRRFLRSRALHVLAPLVLVGAAGGAVAVHTRGSGGLHLECGQSAGSLTEWVTTSCEEGGR